MKTKTILNKLAVNAVFSVWFLIALSVVSVVVMLETITESITRQTIEDIVLAICSAALWYGMIVLFLVSI